MTNQHFQKFKQNKRGYYSLILFSIIFVLSFCAEFLSNDKPLMVKYEGQYYFPYVQEYPETTFGGDFETPADYRDSFILEQISSKPNFAMFPLNPHSYKSINYELGVPVPSPPSRFNILGTDDRGRDVLARLVYGFRISILFGLALTIVSTISGILIGATMGYFGGKVDLFGQRIIEIWSSMPALYLLIIFATIFKPSIWLLLGLLSLFSWIGLSDYVRAEFLKSRNLDYVTAAKAMGVSNIVIMYRHLLPNGMTPVITFLPFSLSGAIISLTSLDFLGLGVPAPTPSLGELLSQGKSNIDAWWISLSTFAVLVVTLVLLIFIGEALREAYDPRKK